MAVTTLTMWVRSDGEELTRKIVVFNRLLVDLHIVPKPLAWFGADATLGLWG
jgi:hypothetical protein